MIKEVIAHFRKGKIKFIKISYGKDVFTISKTNAQTKHSDGTITFDAVSTNPPLILEIKFDPVKLTFDIIGSRKL